MQQSWFKDQQEIQKNKRYDNQDDKDFNYFMRQIDDDDQEPDEDIRILPDRNHTAKK